MIWYMKSFRGLKRKDDDEKVLLNKRIDGIDLNFYLVQDFGKADEIKEYYYEYYEDDFNIHYNCSLKINKKALKWYNNVQIGECIKKSNVVFFLDCPWLAKEDFNIVNEGNLEQYAKWIQQASYKNDIDNFSHEQVPFNRSHLLASINDQLNRLAVDNIAKYGKVVRVFKEYLLEWIQQQVEIFKNNKQYKSIFVYNSSMRGIALSDYADYPIIREESYSNKRFSIMRFSTRENICIPVVDKKSVYISLWSLVKYVDISFAYIGIKDYFSEILPSFIDESSNLTDKTVRRDIISIMRNVVFIIKYRISDKNNAISVDVQTTFCKPIRAYLENKDFQNISEVFIFFEKIIKEIIFRNSKGLGDDSIRDAFERCLYNQSRTVEDLFFLHIYSDLRKNDSLSRIAVVYDWMETDPANHEIDKLVPNFDSFGDKRAYNKLFDYLDLPRYPEYAVNSIINQTNKIFKENNNLPHSIEILQNMVKVCELYDYTETFLYSNLKKLSQNR